MGEEVKVGYRVREEVSSIMVVDGSEWYRQLQRYYFKVIFIYYFIIYSNNENMIDRERCYSLLK